MINKQNIWESLVNMRDILDATEYPATKEHKIDLIASQEEIEYLANLVYDDFQRKGENYGS